MGKVYTATRQASSALHTTGFAACQAYQANLLKDIDAVGDAAPHYIEDLRHTTDRALRATKQVSMLQNCEILIYLF